MIKKIAMAVVLVAGSFAAGAWWEWAKLDRSLKDLAWVQANYLRQQGGSYNFGSYELYSLDAGKHWFSVERVGEDGLQAVGPADPKLLAHLKMVDEIFRQAERPR